MPNEPVLFLTKKDGKQHVIAIPNGRALIPAYRTNMTQDQYCVANMDYMSILFLIAQGHMTQASDAKEVMFEWYFNGMNK